MRLFGGFGNADPGKERREESIRRIEQGGLPLNAVDRLQNASEHPEFFTSDLSPAELLLTRDCGFTPVGQVMGSSVYHVGWQQIWNTSAELAVLTQAYAEARNLAFARLEQEAKILGADGVVGVRLRRNTGDMEVGSVEFIAIGTAVRRLNAPPRNPDSKPFVSNLSGQDHWTLRQAGMIPVGFAFGNCVFYQMASWNTANTMNAGVFGSGWRNQEITEYTQALFVARELSTNRMAEEAYRLGADGIVGVTLESQVENIPGDQNRQAAMMIHFTVFGTAIKKDPARGDMPAPKLVLPIS